MGRRPCCEKVGLKKGRWTAEEDEILSKYIQDNGEGSWRSLPENAGLLRCGKSCRLRWINYLRSDLKRGNISADEEDVIVKLHASLGNRWSLIASHLPGRTDNEIKNYWNSHLCRQIHVFRRVASSVTLPNVVDDGIISKRRGGRTGRRAKGTSKSSNSKKSPLSSTSEPANGDVLLASTPELEKETLADIDERESSGEKDSCGEPFTGSCNSDEREYESSMQKETETVKGQLVSSINGGLLASNDSLESGSMDVEWFLTIAEDDNENGDSCNNKVAVSEEEENNGDWQSLFSVASSFEDLETWGWESLVQGEAQWNEEETTLPSLWEEDDWKLQGCENVEQKNLVSWLFS